MKPTLTLIAASTMLAALAIAQPGKDPQYTVTDLGVVPGGTFSYAGVISNSGRIAGYASPADGTWRAALWLNGQLKNIGRPGLGGQNSEAFGINLFGQASGEAQTTIRQSLPHPPAPDAQQIAHHRGQLEVRIFQPRSIWL